MSEPFLSEIRILSFPYAPKNWAFCNGQIIGISQNQALFALLGTTYGGDGVRTFGLPDLRNRVPIHAGQSTYGSYPLGSTGGERTHTLQTNEVPPHTHALNASPNAGTVAVPTGNLLGSTGTANMYVAPKAPVQMTAAMNQVGGAPHPNVQPYLSVNFSIALAGIFPSRT